MPAKMNCDKDAGLGKIFLGGTTFLIIFIPSRMPCRPHKIGDIKACQDFPLN